MPQWFTAPPGVSNGRNDRLAIRDQWRLMDEIDRLGEQGPFSHLISETPLQSTMDAGVTAD